MLVSNIERADNVNSTDLLLQLYGEVVGAAERKYRYNRLYQHLANSTMFRQLVEKGGV
jgi:aspartyl/asparaginyl-tRNA synthetase